MSIAELLGSASTQPSDYRGQIERMLADLNDDERLFLMDFMQRFVKFSETQRV